MSATAPRADLALPSLPDNVLVSIFCHLPFEQRLRLSQVCQSLYWLCRGPSPMWRQVEAAARLPFQGEPEKGERLAAEVALLEAFSRWLAPRAEAVEELSFAAISPEPIDPLEHTLLPVPAMLLAFCRADTALPLTKLSIEWPEEVLLDARHPLPLPALGRLRKLAFPAVAALRVGGSLPPLTDFSLADGTLTGMLATLNGPWLPPSVTTLYLESVGLRALPPVLSHLPSLRSLVIGHNRLTQASLDPLTLLTQLEELNISESYLPSFPQQVCHLTNLRLLYLHNAFNRNARVALAAWDALRPLSRLVFLSVSGNRLEEVPPGVAGLSHLQALHIEENELLAGLPVAPFLSSLRELLLDWQAALDSPAQLAAATRLSRLVLSGHRAVDEGQYGISVRPASAAEPLLAALAAMPALRVVEDVFGEEDTVTAPVARVMWQLGRRCPSVALRTISTTDVGWDLAGLEKRLAGGN